MSVDIQHCMRVFGGSCRECVCMLPGKAGWAECPPEAKGLLPERKSSVMTEHGEIPLIEVRANPGPALAGEFCHSCGSPNMVRTGTCMTCGDCGDSSGGCS